LPKKVFQEAFSASNKSKLLLFSSALP